MPTTRPRPGDIHVDHDPLANRDGTTAVINLTNAPETLDMVLNDGLIRYTAPGTTDRLEVNVTGLDTPGLDDRPIQAIGANIHGIENGVRFQNGQQIVLDAGKGLDGSITRGNLDLHLGTQDPSTTGQAGDGRLDIRMEKLHVGEFLFQATSPDATVKTPGTDWENYITIVEDQESYALGIQLTDVDRITYTATAPATCGGIYTIHEAELQTAPYQDVLISRENTGFSQCDHEVKDTYWVLELDSIPSTLSLSETKIKGKRVETDGLSLGPEGLDQLRFWTASKSVVVSAEGIPGDETTVLDWQRGAAGKLVFRPSGGKAIDRVRAGFATEDGRFGAALSLRDVNIHLEWDLDGDTRYGDRFVFADTDSHYVKLSVLLFTEHAGLDFNIAGVRAEDFQYAAPDGFFEKLNPKAWFNGYLDLDKLTGEMDASVKLGGEWYPIPQAREVLTR